MPPASRGTAPQVSRAGVDETASLRNQVDQWRQHGALLSQAVRDLQKSESEARQELAGVRQALAAKQAQLAALGASNPSDALTTERAANSRLRQLLSAQAEKIELLEKMVEVSGAKADGSQPQSWLHRWLAPVANDSNHERVGVGAPRSAATSGGAARGRHSAVDCRSGADVLSALPSALPPAMPSALPWGLSLPSFPVGFSNQAQEGRVGSIERRDGSEHTLRHQGVSLPAAVVTAHAPIGPSSGQSRLDSYLRTDLDPPERPRDLGHLPATRRKTLQAGELEQSKRAGQRSGQLGDWLRTPDANPSAEFAPQGSPQASPQGSPPASTQGSPPASTQGSPHASPQGSQQTSPPMQQEAEQVHQPQTPPPPPLPPRRGRTPSPPPPKPTQKPVVPPLLLPQSQREQSQRESDLAGQEEQTPLQLGSANESDVATANELYPTAPVVTHPHPSHHPIPHPVTHPIPHPN